MRHNKARTNQPFMGLLNYLGGRGSSAGGEGSSRHVESDVVTVGGVALGRRLVVWFVLVSLVRALAITVFEVITDFNAEAGNPENGKV